MSKIVQITIRLNDIELRRDYSDDSNFDDVIEEMIETIKDSEEVKF